jgi:uncharacterized protein (DUF1501 family)
VVAGGGPVPDALFARQAVCAAVNALDEYASADLRAVESAAHGGDGIEDYVRRTTLEAKSTVERLRELKKRTGAKAKYPTTELARRLGLVAELVKAGLETPVYYVVQPGYDTHQLQAEFHAHLLAELGDAVRAFHDDLDSCGLAGRVLLMTFSEFGRRVEENASFGTDHGTAAPVLLVGEALRAGPHGATPDLSDLVDGDLRTSVDFRSVYATVLERWLGIDSQSALNGAFEPLPLLKA